MEQMQYFGGNCNQNIDRRYLDRIESIAKVLYVERRYNENEG